MEFYCVDFHTINILLKKGSLLESGTVPATVFVECLFINSHFHSKEEKANNVDTT